MNLWLLTYRHLGAHPLRLLLNLLLLTLGVGIISLLLVMENELDRQFRRNLEGIQMVVGAKGSPLQLILSSVYHLDTPTGNIPLDEAQKLQKHPLVKKGIPLAYGDSYKGYRIVGTDSSYLELYRAKLRAGRIWEGALDITAGAQVAARLGLQVGDTFQSQHGLDGGGEEHAASFRVVGILKPSGSVLDQLLLTTTSSLWEVHDHAEDQEHDHEREITAMLLQFRSPMGVVALPRFINENTPLQAALPAYEISRLLENIGLGVNVLQGIALAVILVSGISMFISLYTSLRERHYELALMRSLGASRRQIFFLILQEGVLLSFIGAVLGWGAGRIGLWVMGSWAEQMYGYYIIRLKPLPAEWLLLVAVVIVGGLAALIPAITAYRSDLSRTLAEG